MTDTLIRDVSDTGEPRPRRPRARWRSGVLIAIFVVAGFAATGVLPVREYLERGDVVNEAQIELDRLRAENSELADNVDALYTGQEVERIAREQYGFVRPGEIVYVVTEPEVVQQDQQSVPVPIAVDPVPVVAEQRSFFQRVWDFVTGNDQKNDG